METVSTSYRIAYDVFASERAFTYDSAAAKLFRDVVRDSLSSHDSSFSAAFTQRPEYTDPELPDTIVCTLRALAFVFDCLDRSEVRSAYCDYFFHSSSK